MQAIIQKARRKLDQVQALGVLIRDRREFGEVTGESVEEQAARQLRLLAEAQQLLAAAGAQAAGVANAAEATLKLAVAEAGVTEAVVFVAATPDRQTCREKAAPANGAAKG